MIQPCVSEFPRLHEARGGLLRRRGREVGESAHEEDLVGSQEHPHLDGEPAPAIPSPQDPPGDPLEPERLEQAHRRIVVFRHGRKYPGDSA